MKYHPVTKQGHGFRLKEPSQTLPVMCLFAQDLFKGLEARGATVFFFFFVLT